MKYRVAGEALIDDMRKDTSITAMYLSTRRQDPTVTFGEFLSYFPEFHGRTLDTLINYLKNQNLLDERAIIDRIYY